ncbi:MobP2 family relaxase [Bacillus subtilis]|nr:MobP2 family relaxase [Bacillus subtilis]MEC0363626.1 MobP2 family relaxase [Bacillus subtilis]
MILMSKITPGVVLKTRFVTPEKKSFQDYVDYVDREEAKSEVKLNQKMFALYQDYMDNPDKTSSLFTEQSDALTNEQKKNLKQLFKKAQEKNSVMWQDVITFHNPWLEKQGVYDPKTHSLDEKKIMDVTRRAMKEMLRKEGLEKSAVWSAAIHYNTDNIHIHVATIEPEPTRTRGKRKPKTLDAMKSQVVNNLLERGQQHQLINDIIRKRIVGEKKQDSTIKWRNRELKPLFFKIFNHLPEDKRQWQYNYNTIKPLRPYIDELSRRYIEKHHKEDFAALNKKLDREVKELREAYGDGKVDKKRYENYKQNKINDLYKRMGNSFLKEMKDYANEKERIEKNLERRSEKGMQLRKGYQLQFALKKIERSFRSDYDQWKNQRHYERLQNKIEYENERG